MYGGSTRFPYFSGDVMGVGVRFGRRSDDVNSDWNLFHNLARNNHCKIQPQAYMNSKKSTTRSRRWDRNQGKYFETMIS